MLFRLSWHLRQWQLLNTVSSVPLERSSHFRWALLASSGTSFRTPMWNKLAHDRTFSCAKSSESKENLHSPTKCSLPIIQRVKQEPNMSWQGTHLQRLKWKFIVQIAHNCTAESNLGALYRNLCQHINNCNGITGKCIAKMEMRIFLLSKIAVFERNKAYQ